MNYCDFCKNVSEYIVKYYSRYFRCCRDCNKGINNLGTIKFYKKYRNILDVVTFNSVLRSLKQSVFKGV